MDSRRVLPRAGGESRNPGEDEMTPEERRAYRKAYTIINGPGRESRSNFAQRVDHQARAAERAVRANR